MEENKGSAMDFATVELGPDGQYSIVNRHREAKAAHRVASRSTRKRPLFAARLAQDGSISELLSGPRGSTLEAAPQAEPEAQKNGAKPRVTVELRDARDRLVHLADRLEDLAGKVRAVADLENELREVFGSVFAEVRTTPQENSEARAA